ncbi:ATP-binding protein [Paraburkholderia kururiensis]|uniref:ATP-binding protein n=1 Tax=Paraburkholderia kururiensis TaxID=984307 RepID=UPI0018F408AF|nr:ATP-binding protein [Paraburkholderia kururiensis]
MIAPASCAGEAVAAKPYRRCIGWIGTTALAMGGSNQSLFLIAALFAGQGDIPGQGSAAVPLLIVGLLLSYAALPGWIELVMMSPRRVGGIAAACTEAFAPYGRILSTLTGTCYWWGWVPTCGLTAILSATAIHEWYLPDIAVPVLACSLVLLFTAVNLLGIRWVTRLAVPIATCSALLAFVSALAPVLTGATDWHRAVDFHLTTPFAGWFGNVTSLMAGLYLIGFAAPAFEAAACHAAETRDAGKNVPRAMKASAAMASVYFVVLPLVWLGTLGPQPLGGDLGQVLGPTFAPVFGALAKSAAIWFMMFNMFHGTMQPLAGAARTLSQLADDGLAPRFLSTRNCNDVPVNATLVTAGFAIGFLLIGDPIWLVAAANFTYLIGIAAPSVAVWLLRRDAPHAVRVYRAPRYTIGLGLAAACVWAVATMLGFEQFGLPTVVFGLAMAYSGAAAYAWRRWEDRRRAGLPGIAPTLHLRLTGAMLLVLALDGAGYMQAVTLLPATHLHWRTVLEDIFVMVAMLTITVGIVLPGVISHSAEEISKAAKKLATGTLRDFSAAMSALGRGDLDAAHAAIDMHRVYVRSRDEMGEMAHSFNAMQTEVANAAVSLVDAREGLRNARERLTVANQSLRQKIVEQQQLAEELMAAKTVAEVANAAKNQFLARMSHELRTPLNGVVGAADLLLDLNQTGEQYALLMSIRESGTALKSVIDQILDVAEIGANTLNIRREAFDPMALLDAVAAHYRRQAEAKGLTLLHQSFGQACRVLSDPDRVGQIVANLLSNAIKFTAEGGVMLSTALSTALAARGVDGADAADGVVLTIVVKDTGPGIAHGARETIFASFAQADETRTREHDGAGVGLFLVRELVKRLDGQIHLDSEPGRGTTFTVVLPFTLAQHSSAASTHAHVPSAARDEGDPMTSHNDPHARALPARTTVHDAPRILLAEDNPTNQAVAMASLRRLGLAAQLAGDGEEAVRLFGQHRFDLVLMDCHMPKMDGIAATAAIRTLEAARGTASVPIIAITADMTSANVVQCRSVGVTAIMAKPFTFADFSTVVKAHLKDGDLSATAGTLAAPAAICEAVRAAAAIDHACIDALRELADEDGPDVALDIVSTYLDTASQQVSALRTALEGGVWMEVARLSHTLMSSSAYVGAMGFSRLMKETGQQAREGRPDDRDAASAHIGAVYTCVHASLADLLVHGGAHD